MRFILLFMTVTAGVVGGAMFWLSDDQGNELAVVEDVVSGSVGSGNAAKTAEANVDGHNQSRTQSVGQAPGAASDPLQQRFFGAGLSGGSLATGSLAGRSLAGSATAPAPSASVLTVAKPDAWQTDVVVSPRTHSTSTNSTVLMTTGSLPAPRDIPRHTLVRDIQRELKRVGCYGGEATGEWNMASKRAMQAFLERSNSTLPTGDPDLFQLTLVRGYSGAACRPGDASTITARTQSPRVDQARSETQRGEPTRTGHSQSLSQHTPVAIRALPQQHQTTAQAAPPALPAPPSQTQSVAQAQQQPTASSGQPAVVVFEGRMAVGGPRTPQATDTSVSPPITSSAPVVPQPARIARPSPSQPSASAQRPRRERNWTGNFFNM